MVDELWSTLVLANRALEALLGRDTPFAPSGLFARLFARRALAALPFANETLRVLLDKLPGGHVYRSAAFLPATFACDWAYAEGELPVLSAARLWHDFVRHGLHFDQSRQKGVVFHMMNALAELGLVGLTAVGNSHEEADELYRKTVAALDSEATSAS